MRKYLSSPPRRAIRVVLAAIAGLGVLVIIGINGIVPAQSSFQTPNRPGTQPSQAPSPLAAASLTPAASPTPSPTPSPEPSTGPIAPPNVPTGGHWVVNGATVKAGGALATEIDAGGNVFTGSASAAKGSWSTRFAVSGQGPVTAQGTASGPSPFLVDIRLHVFGLPINVQGTPGSDLSVSIGTPRTSLLIDARPVAAVQRRALLAESPEAMASRIVTDTLRAAVAFAIVGWLLLLVAPGLRRRGRMASASVPLSRLGIGAILFLDIPLGALALIVLGVPLGLWWVGLVVLAIFAAAVVAGYAFSGYQLGVVILERTAAGRLLWLAEVALGVLLLVVAGQIPYVGALISIVAVVYGLGSMIYAPAKTAVQPAEMLELERPQATTELPASGRPLVE